MTRGARAHGWVGLVPIATLAASCLVTSSAEFEDPQQTQPVLVADTALPDPREIVVVEGSAPVTFSAIVRSDEDLGESIKGRLLIDYGILNVDGRPYLASIPAGEILPATSAEEDRIATAVWVPGAPPVSPGCHTFTLMVSHAFDEGVACPQERADSSHLTWFVFVCEDGQPCPPPIDDPRIDCPKPVTRCPESTSDGDGSTGSGPI